MYLLYPIIEISRGALLLFGINLIVLIVILVYFNERVINLETKIFKLKAGARLKSEYNVTNGEDGQ